MVAGHAASARRSTSAFPATAVLVLLAVATLATLPLWLPFRAIGTAIQMQVATLFALAFNILWRQTRLLSFGHAAFFGIGMFATIHLMRAAAGGAVALPLPLLPLPACAPGSFSASSSGTSQPRAPAPISR